MGLAVAEMAFQGALINHFCFFCRQTIQELITCLFIWVLLTPCIIQGKYFLQVWVRGLGSPSWMLPHGRDKTIKLICPEDIYDTAALLRDDERFDIESIHSREIGDIATAVSITRLHNITGKYTGKNDPVMLVRIQGVFPAAGEVHTLAH